MKNIDKIIVIDIKAFKEIETFVCLFFSYNKYIVIDLVDIRLRVRLYYNFLEATCFLDISLHCCRSNVNRKSIRLLLAVVIFKNIKSLLHNGASRKKKKKVFKFPIEVARNEDADALGKHHTYWRGLEAKRIGNLRPIRRMKWRESSVVQPRSHRLSMVPQ